MISPRGVDLKTPSWRHGGQGNVREIKGFRGKYPQKRPKKREK